MRGLLRLWVASLFNPRGVVRLFRMNGRGVGFTWWTTLWIYLVSYLSLLSLFLGFSATQLGPFVFLIMIIFVMSLTLVKNYFYALILSYRTKILVSYHEICLITTLSDTPLILGLPVLYLLSQWIGGGFILILLAFFLYVLLRNRTLLFQDFFGVSAKFIYIISIGIWANIFLLFLIFSIYIGLSLRVLMHYLS